MNFVELCLHGTVQPSEIDRFVEEWHEGRVGQNLKLHEHLGLSWEEYSAWVTRPSTLPSLLESRQRQ